MATRILLIIAWVIMVLLTVTQYAEDVAGAQAAIGNKIIAGIIFIIGAPIFCAYTALSDLLDILLPGGWEDDNDNREIK